MDTKLPDKTLPQGIIEDVIKKQTKDMSLAAAFHVEGVRFLSLDKTDKTRQIFTFEGGENADRVEREYYQQTLVVGAYQYAASMRLIKSLLHS